MCTLVYQGIYSLVHILGLDFQKMFVCVTSDFLFYIEPDLHPRVCILSRDGQKMSKRKKNYPDPMDVVNKYGADAIR